MPFRDDFLFDPPPPLLPGYLKAVWPELFGSVFGVWAAPGGFESIQKCGGRSPPPFWMVSKPPGAAQTPKTDPNKSGQTAFRYPEAAGAPWCVLSRELLGPGYLGCKCTRNPEVPETQEY